MLDKEMRKPVSVPKHVFTISDSEGQSKNFTVKQADKLVRYTVDDVAAVVDTCVEIIKEAITKGESITYMGLGTLALKYRPPRVTKIFWGNGGAVEVPPHWYPRFTPGTGLKRCAKLYELSIQDKAPIDLPAFYDEDGEEDAD